MRRGGQGEALAVWAVWALTLLVVVVTYSRIDAAELYNVQGNGLGLGLSRARGAHQLAVRARRDRARARGDEGPAAPRLVDRGPAIALCATMPLVRRPVAPQRTLAEPRPRRRRRARARPGRRRDAARRHLARSRGSRATRVRVVVARRRARPLASLDRRGARLPSAGRSVHGGGAVSRRRTGTSRRPCTSASTTGCTARCCCSPRSSSRGCRPAARLRAGCLGGTAALAGIRRRQCHPGLLAGAACQARDGGLGDPERSLSRAQAGDARHRRARRARRPGCSTREQAILRA